MDHGGSFVKFGLVRMADETHFFQIICYNLDHLSTTQKAANATKENL